MAAAHARRSARLPRAVLPLSRSPRSSSAACAARRRAARRPHGSADARDRVVHGVAGARVDRAHDRGRAARGVRARSLPIQGPERGQRARRRPVRAADRRRRARVPRDPARRRRAGLGADPGRARVLQRRRRRADRRDVLGEPRPAPERGGSDARRVPSCAPPRGHRSAPRAGARLCGRHRLPVLVHVVRRRPDPRRAAGTRRSRPRSTTRPSASSTCEPRPCSPSSSSPASWLRSGSRCGSSGDSRPTGQLRPEGDTLRPARTTRDKLVVGASLGGLALFLGLPLAVLVERSLAVGDGYGLDAYEALGRPTSVLLAAPWEAVVNSIVYAAAATLIAVVVGGLAAFAVADSRGRLIDSLVLLPLGVSAVMLGLGFLIAFDTPPLDFRAAPWLVPVAQALIAIPFVVRILVPTLRSIDPHQREAAALLGASPGRVRREIDLPIVSRGVAVAAGFAFAISLGEFGATVFLARPDRPTLPVAIFRFLGRPGRDQRRAGLRARGRAHGRHRRRGAPRRAGARAPRRVVLMLHVDSVTVAFDGDEGPRRRVARRRGRRDRHRARPERLREDDPAARDRRPAGTRRRPRPARRDRPRRHAAASARRRPRVPGSRALPASRRLRQRRVRAADARRLAGRDRAREPPSCSRSSAWPDSSGARSARSRAASSSASRSRARSRRSRASSSSTSRSGRSTAVSETDCSTTSSACSTSSR